MKTRPLRPREAKVGYFYTFSPVGALFIYNPVIHFCQELRLKHFLVLSLLALSFSSLAGVVEDLQKKNCESDEVLSSLGEGGSCQVVVVPAVSSIGVKSCSGKFMEVIDCKIIAANFPFGSFMNVSCAMEDEGETILDQDFMAETVSYNVTTLLHKADGTTKVVNDPKDYSIVSSPIVTLKTATGEAPAIDFEQQDGPIALTNVVCE